MSEIKNRALSKKYEEFMSRKCTFDDFIRLRANKIHQGMTLDFGALRLFFKLGGKLFLQHGNITLKTIDNPTRKQVDEVYHFFTGEHLDFSPTKVYNWETCFSRGGWYITSASNIQKIQVDESIETHYNTYPTKEDAESALAHCQLLHIINKINEDYPKVNDSSPIFIFWDTTLNRLNIGYNSSHDGGLKLTSKKGAEVLIRDNEQLLKTYFKIK